MHVKKMKARKVRKKIKTRKARKKNEGKYEAKVRRHVGIGVHKARRHVRQVGA